MSDRTKCLLRLVSCTLGFGLGQLYYKYFIKDIPVLQNEKYILGLVISLILALGNLISVQVRCISLLFLPMYCGKPGRGVLKVIVLTYVIAGPITNMGLNAKEVVRVFACSRQLSYNLSNTKYTLLYHPLQRALLAMTPEINEIKNVLSNVTAPIEQEIEEDETYIDDVKQENERIRRLLEDANLSSSEKIQTNSSQNVSKIYERKYENKMNSRCEYHLSHGVDVCLNVFAKVCDACKMYTNSGVCETILPSKICNIKRIVGANICEFVKQSELEENYKSLKSAETDILEYLEDIKIYSHEEYKKELFIFQIAKETGGRVLDAFEEKTHVMQLVNTIVQVFLALMFLRIVVAAQTYHDQYLTDIDHDNLYITGYFKRIDERRRTNGNINLLPLKKMERNRYIHVDALTYIPSERNKFLTQILKVMLEAVTATTFVMLDRLFYEALEVVRRHALNTSRPSLQDLDIEIQGEGTASRMLRKITREINTSDVKLGFTNEMCLPQPHAMAFVYYVKIYAGYLWILLLLYINPYTLRLRRLICSLFYPGREKQRILHLYNDILKKRMRLQKTLRRRAVHAVRAYYLSGESLLSLRIKFPKLLRWLAVLPVARMKCLICEETEPRRQKYGKKIDSWQRCPNKKCPFVYCEECWKESARCLACDPALADLTDIDSLSDDAPRY